MQFKHPELLYALFLLLIPIVVHLFQLRRFEKVAFTNVAFLKKVKIQTRKSARLKKLLLLTSRLLLLTAIIFAFAQPYFSENKTNTKPKTILYIDNSLSMQANNGSSELFKKAIQDIISDFSSSDKISILTNNEFYKDLNPKELKNQLLSIDYHPIAIDLNTVLLKLKNEFTNKKNIKNHAILISDFQSQNNTDKLLLDSLTDYSFVQLQTQKKANISIDSVYISKQSAQDINLKVILKSFNVADENLSVSLFKENILIGKTTTKILKNQTSNVTFTFPIDGNFNGKITIEDNLIPFDNTHYFSLNKLEKIDVLSIGQHNEFLSKIYTNNEFNFESKQINQLDYNKLTKKHLIVLNELNEIPTSLQQTLKDFTLKGGSLVIIPSTNINLTNYNQFFNSLNIGSINEKIDNENKITKINFSHQILSKVFEKQISNFQYPNVKSSFKSNFKNASTILSFENQQAFISQSNIKDGKLYWVSAAINTKNSNFKNSPLIVPVFYNFGKQSFNITELYYTIGKINEFEIQTQIKKDGVLQIKNEQLNFIPLQQINESTVKIITEDNPLIANHYQVVNNDKLIKNIAYNYDKSEGNTTYSDIKSLTKKYKNTNFSNNINQAFNSMQEQYQTKSLWKWFLGLSILFLIIEMFLVKFWK